MSNSILVIEDNLYLRKYISKSLSDLYTVHEAGSGKEALRMLKTRPVQMILLDLKLGDMDGAEILRLLRAQSIETPIIVISSVRDLQTRLELFETGCDDYIMKPFHKEELLARIQRMFTRLEPDRSGGPFLEELREEPFAVNFVRRQVYKNDQPVEMSARLFDIFSFLLRHKDRMVSKRQLYTAFWDPSGEVNDNTVSVHIHLLRKAIEDDPKDPVYLKTIHGSGIIFSIPE